MAVLVTGGLGFVGRHIVDELDELDEQVISYNRDFSSDPRENVIPIQGELFDLPALVHTLSSYRVDAVIHTAAMSHPEISISLPLTTFAANVDGTLKLFEAMRLAGVKRVVNFSSECAYGDQDEDVLLREDATPRPNTPYGVTKVTTEHLGRVYKLHYGLEVVSLRVTEVYGPGLRMPEVLKDMLRAAMDGVPFTMPHGLDHRFQFIHVRDAAHAAILASRSAPFRQSVYNITGDRQITLRGLRGLVLSRFPEAKIDIGEGYIPNWDRQGPFDGSAAQRDLGYRPAWSLERGLDDYISWLAEHDA